MKKFVIVCLLLLTLGVLVTAFAEPIAEATNTTVYTWSQIGTVTGATAATLLIVQFIKLPLDRIWKIPTRAVVYVIALLLMLAARAFTEGLNVDDIPLIAVNAANVAFSAMGAYEVSFGRNKQLEPSP